MTETNQDIINRFAMTVSRSSSYEEFYLKCMADDEMSAFLGKLSIFYLASDGKTAEDVSPLGLYKLFKGLG